MKFADADWWNMVAATVAALHVESGRTPTPETVGPMFFRARELGQDGGALRAWLAEQPRPAAPLPAPPVPVPPVPVPTPAGRTGDAINIREMVMTRQSPDVSEWPIGTNFTYFEIDRDGRIRLNFDRRNGPHAWPFVLNMEGGQIQYTLWIVCRIDGRWFACAAIEGISRGEDDNYLGGGDVLEPGQLASNWYYHAGEPLATYQPRPGEMVGWFVTSGAQRRDDVHPDGIAERSNVIVAPFRGGRVL